MSALRLLLTLIALPLLSAPAVAQDKNHPFSKAKVGDWITYKIETAAGAMTMKQTVTAKDSDSVTLKIEMSAGGKPLHAAEQRVSLKEPFDPSRMLQSAESKAPVVKLAEGNETLSLAGKKYPCSWVKSKITTQANGQNYETTSTMWVSKDVPLGGLVKAETETAGAKTLIELTGMGSK
jgi:hypothetical protein